jgi:hypothetical protein
LFFSRNSIFLSQQISQQYFSAGLSAQPNGSKDAVLIAEPIWSNRDCRWRFSFIQKEKDCRWRSCGGTFKENGIVVLQNISWHIARLYYGSRRFKSHGMIVLKLQRIAK